MTTLHKKEYMRGNIDRAKIYGTPAAIDAEIIRRYFDALADEHPSDYRNHIKSALRHYYKWLIKAGAIKEMPDLGVPIRKNGNERGRDGKALNEKDVAALRRHFNPALVTSVKANTEKAVRDNLLFQCLINLGVRKGELLLLRYSDFDNGINQVNIRSTKTEGISKYGGNRIMPLAPSLYKLIEEYQGDSPDSDPVFTITDYTVWEIIKAAGKAVGVEWLTPHTFRHYCMTRFGEVVGSDGMTPVFSIKERSMMFGVSPEIIAERYDHPDPKNIVSKALKSGVYSE